MRAWFRTLTQLLLVAVGLLLVVAGFNDPELSVGAGLLMGGLCIGSAAVWRTVSRNSAAPDIVDGPVTLGNGHVEVGQTVPAPRSKMAAVIVGGAAFAVGSGLLVASAWAGRDWFLLIVALLGVGLFGGGTAVRLRHWDVQEWVAFSPTGITVHNVAGHLTYPWDSITEVGIAEMQHSRGGTTRMFAADPDPDQVLGERGRGVETLGRYSYDGWTLALPGTVYDVGVDDLLDLAHSWRPAPGDHSGASDPPS